MRNSPSDGVEEKFCFLEIVTINMSNSNNHTPRLTVTTASSSYPNTSATTMIPTTRSTIDEVREQYSGNPTGADFDEEVMDVPVKKYPPLPDITQSGPGAASHTYVRTETTLIPPKQRSPVKSKMVYHFAPSQRGYLPALGKTSFMPTITNTMDLDEDLPQHSTSNAYRAATYTSPGERVISPIKRPSAPSPPTSAQVKRFGQPSFASDDQDDDDDEDHHPSEQDEVESQLFDESFQQVNPPINTNNRRINHYGHHNRPAHLFESHPAIAIDRRYDDWAHPLDSNDFEQ